MAKRPLRLRRERKVISTAMVDMPSEPATLPSPSTKTPATAKATRTEVGRSESVEEQSRRTLLHDQRRMRFTRQMAIGAAAVGIVLISPWAFGRVAQTVHDSRTRSAGERAATTTRAATPLPKSLSVREEPVFRPPGTPKFASAGRLSLFLPYPKSKLTAMEFHQATNPTALPMTPFGLAYDRLSPARRTKLVAMKKRGSKTPIVYHTVWRRGRSGRPDRAVDIGAKAGTPVRAPVTGTVVKVRRYLLYRCYPDYEIWIRPTGLRSVGVVIIHIDRPLVRAADHVYAGTTEIGHVRNLARYMSLQLDSFSKDGGNHVHLQVNRIPKKKVRRATTKGAGRRGRSG